MRARLEKAVRMPVMRVLVDFDNEGFGSMASWTDITDYVTEVSASKQKEGEVLGGVSSDIVTLTVDNSKNAFSPNNPNSFFYKKQKSNIRFVLQAGFQNEELTDYMIGYIQTFKPTWKGKTYTLNATCPMEKLKKAKVPKSSYKNVTWNFLVNALLEQAGIEEDYFDITIPKTEITYSYFKFEEEKCFDALKKLMEVVCGVAYFDGFKFVVETQLALDYYKNKEHKHELLADDFFEFEEEIDSGVVVNKVDVTSEPKEVCPIEVVVKTPDNMTNVDNETTTYDGSGYVYVKNLPLYYDDSTEITIENLTRGGEVTWELWNAEVGRVKLDELGLSNVIKGDSLSINYTYQSLVLLPNQVREYVLQSDEEVDQYLDPDVVAWNPDITANIPFSTTPDKAGTVSRQYQRIDEEGNITIALKNNTSDKTSISTLQFRGYPVRVKNPIEVHAKDTPSIETYDEKEATISNNYINNIGHAEKLAQFIIDTKADIPKTLNVDISGYAELMLSDVCLVTEEQSYTNHLMEIHQIDSTFSANNGWITKLTLIEIPEGDWTYKGFGGESAVIKPPKTIYETFYKGPVSPSDITLIWFNTTDNKFYVYDDSVKGWIASTAEYDVNIDDIEGFDEALEQAKTEINNKVEIDIGKAKDEVNQNITNTENRVNQTITNTKNELNQNIQNTKDEVITVVADNLEAAKEYTDIQTATREVAILRGTEFPATALQGQLFVNTNTNDMYRWTGDKWEPIGVTNEELTAANQEIVKAKQEASEAKQEALNAQKELEDAKEEIDGNIQQAQQDIEQAQQDLQQTAQDLQQTSQDLQQTKQNLQQTQNDLTSAKNNLQSQADALKQRATNLEGSVSTINTNIDTINGTLSVKADKTEVENMINGIEIGGRNLIRNSHIKMGGNVVASTNHVPTSISGSKLTITPLEAGKTYTFSADVDILAGNPTHISVKPFAWYNNANVMEMATYANGNSEAEIIDNHIEITFTIKEHATYTANNILVYHGKAGETLGNLINIYNIKLEEGNVATAWTPAPEDIQTEVTNVTNRVTQNELDIVANAEAIATKMSQTQVETITNNAINNLQIGGRNYLFNSEVIEPHSNNNTGYPIQNTLMEEGSEKFYRTIRISGTNNARLSLYNNIPVSMFNPALLEGKTVTMSFKARASRDITGTIMCYHYDPINNFPDNNKSVQLTTEWQTYSTTIENFPLVINGIRFAPYTFIIQESDIGTLYIDTKQWKIEIGNKATDWTPAPEDIEKEVTNVTNRVTQNELNIVANAEAIATKMSQTQVETIANNAVNNLQIGGRNLIKNSNFAYDKKDWTGHEGFEIATIGVNDNKSLQVVGELNVLKYHWQTVNLKPNTTYTFTGWYKTENLVYGTTNPHVGFHITYNKNSSWVGEKLLAQYQNGTNDWTKVTVTFTTISDFDKSQFMIYARDITGTLWVDELQLEEGNKATDWTPAPEDTQSQIDAHGTRISSAESTIEQHAGMIATKVEQSTYTTDKNNLQSQINTNKTAITQKADSVTLEAAKTELQTNINNIQIGGRNIILNSAFENNMEKWNKIGTFTNTTSGTTTEKTFNNNLSLKISNSGYTSNAYSTYTQTIELDKLEIGGTYTYSVYLYSDDWTTDSVAVEIGLVQRRENGVDYGNVSFTKKNGEWIKATKTFTIYEDVTIVQTRLNVVKNGTVYFSSPKLEKGNKVTDWTPAPEDLQSQISENKASIAVNAEAIALKASQSSLDTLSGRVSSNTAQLEVQAGQIASKVTQAQVDTAINNIQIGGRNYIKDSDFYAELTASAGGNIHCGDTHGYITYAVSNTELMKAISNNFATISFEYEHNGLQVAGTKRFGMEFYATGTDSNGENVELYLGAWKNLTVGTVPADKGRISTTKDFRGITLKSIGAILFYMQGLTGTVRFGKPKLEIGNKATAWTPAPEDLENRVSKAETDIIQNANDITLRATKTEAQGYATTAVNNLQIGGRNLLKNTKDKFFLTQSDNDSKITRYSDKQQVDVVTDGNANIYRFVQSWYTIPFEEMMIVDEPYSYSIEVKAVSGSFTRLWSACDIRSSNGRIMDVRTYDDATFKCTGTGKIDLTPADGWVRITGTAPILKNDTVTGALVRIDWSNSESGSVLVWRNVKLEKGNKATAWTEAPEDVQAYTDSAITTTKAEIKVTTDAITNTVSSHTSSINSLNSTVSSHTTQINQNKDAINLRATKTEVTDAINDIQIGGRNLLVYKDITFRGSYTSATANAMDGIISGTGYDYYFTAINCNKLESNKEYTFSMESLQQTDTSNYYGWISLNHYNETTKTTIQQTGILSNNLKSFTFTLDIPANDESFLFVYVSGDNDCDFTIKGLKLEEGTKATTYSPSPEDLIGNVGTGRNMIIRKTETVGQYLNANGALAPEPTHSASDYIAIEPNKTYTFSKITDSTAGSTGGQYFRIQWYNSAKTYINRTPQDTNLYTWTAPANAYYVRVSYPINSNPKMELGSKATPFSLAPEDIETRVSQAETNIALNSEAIALRATKTELENLQVGARNYVLQGNVEKNVTRGTGGNVWCQYNVSTDFGQLSDTKFMISADIKSLNASTDLVADMYIRTASGIASTPVEFRIVPTTTYKRYTKEVTINSGVATSDIKFVYIRIYGGTGAIYTKNVKLETGSKATGYTLAPEDLGTAVSTAKAEIKVTTDAITNTVSSNTTKISGLTTTVNNHTTQIANNANEISLRASKTEMKEYVTMKNANLVTNGFCQFGDNTNFSALTYDGATLRDGIPSFKREGYGGFVASDYIPVDTSRKYRISAWIKATGVADSTTKYSYIGYDCYDVDKKSIGPENVQYQVGSTTTLAQELKDGDTVVYLTSVAGFKKTLTATHQKSLIFWNYKNSAGYQYPVHSYSRYYFNNLWTDANSFDTTNNTITLSKAWTGGTFPAGTSVSQGISGNTWHYSIYSGTCPYVPSEWTLKESTIQGTTAGTGDDNWARFRSGTAYIRYRGTWNSTTGTLWLNSLAWTDVTDEVNAKNYTNNTVESAKAEIKITTDGITQTVNNHTDTLNSHNTRISQNANNITATVTSIQNLSGADNLLRNGNFYKGNADLWTFVGTHTKSFGTEVGAGSYLKVRFTSAGNTSNRFYPDTGTNYTQTGGIQYTLTFMAKASSAVTLTTCTAGNTAYNPKTYSLTTAWQKFTHSYTCHSAGGSVTFWINTANIDVYLTDVKLTFGNEDWERVSKAESDIAANAEAITARVTKTELNNLQIGGRNLLLDTSREVTNNEYRTAGYMPTELLVVGQKYTATMCVTPAANVTHYGLYVSNGYSNPTSLYVTGTNKQVVKSTFTFNGYSSGRIPTTTTESNARIDFYRFPNSGTVTTNSIIHWVKLEKGDKSTDYTVAPEQVISNTAQIEINAGAITSKVEQTLYDADKEMLNAGISGVSSELKQTVTDITATFTSSSGQNLIRNSCGYEGLNVNWYSFNTTYHQTLYDPDTDILGVKSSYYFAPSSSSYYPRTHDIKVEIGETYTLSLMMKVITGGSGVMPYIRDVDNNKDLIYGTKVTTTTNGYELQTLTFKARNTTTIRAHIAIYANSESYVTKIMLHKGSTVLGWSSHPEEIHNGIINMSENGIKVARKDGNGNIKGYTIMSHEEFAGYNDTDGDGTFEKIFYLNEDATVSKRLAVTNEIIMGDMKIVALTNGWGFIPTTSGDKRLTAGVETASEE